MRLKFASQELIDDVDEALESTKQMLGFVPNSLLIMAQRPNMVRAFAGLSREVFMGAELDRELLNLVAHMASTAAGCSYCQAHTAAKISDGDKVSAKLQKIWEFETSDLFSEAEKAALSLARDAALVPNAATDEHFSVLKGHYTERQIIDLVAVISLFGLLNRWNDTLATPLEDGPRELANELLTARGWSAGKHTSS
jgi:uncharacterized peroxidase-related enzyme